MSADVRFAIRSLYKSPAFTALAVSALAIGIGGNAAMFSVVNAVLLRPLPYAQSDRLLSVDEFHPKYGRMSVSWLNFIDWRAQTRTLYQLSAYQAWDVALTSAGQPEKLPAYRISASLFPLLGVHCDLGSGFSSMDDRDGASSVAVITHGLWQRRLGSDPHIIGRAIKLDDRLFTIVGVLPQDFHFLFQADLFLPIGPFGKSQGDRGNHPGIQTVGRLKPGVTPEQAKAEMAAIAVALEKQYPASNSGNTVVMEPLATQFTGKLRAPLLSLMVAIGFVLLIACANVANLLLARAASRGRELAIRNALGAGRGRIARQLLTESVLLAGLGAAFGVGFAWWGLGALEILVPEDIRRVSPIHLDFGVLMFTMSVTLLTALLFGIAPAFQSARIDVQRGLQEGVRGSSTAGFHGWSLRSILIVAEVALALVLLTGAGLTIRSLLALERVDPGFRTERLLTMRLDLPHVRYPKDAQQTVFFDRLLERIKTTPGVSSASGAFCLPLGGGCWSSIFEIGDRPVPPRADLPSADFNGIEPGYFGTLGIPIFEGRDFTMEDTEGSDPVLIVNQTFARKYFPNEDPIGKRIKQGWPEDTEAFRTIVGVVGDAKRAGLDAVARPEAFMDVRQIGPGGLALVIRTSVPDANALISAVRGCIRVMDAELPAYQIRAMDYYLDRSTAPRRHPMVLFTIFACIAVVLAVIGIYGVLSYLVTQRTREMGIRMALGARRGDVLRLVVGHGFRWVGAGVVLGLVCAWSLTRLMQSLLFGVRPSDPLTFSAVSVLLLAVAALACYVPGRRATKVDPMVALRYE